MVFILCWSIFCLTIGDSYSNTVLAADKKIIPKLANDIKLISAGKILDNSKTISQCRPSFGELPGGVITMHVVVQPSSAKSKTGKQNLVYILLFLLMSLWS